MLRLLADGTLLDICLYVLLETLPSKVLLQSVIGSSNAGVATNSTGMATSN